MFQRFIPSDFGTDVDNIEGAIEPAASFFEAKAKIRRAIEAEGIPYTYISCYGFASYFLATLAQENATPPPRDKVVILSDVNAKGIALTSFSCSYSCFSSYLKLHCVLPCTSDFQR